MNNLKKKSINNKKIEIIQNDNNNKSKEIHKLNNDIKNIDNKINK